MAVFNYGLVRLARSDNDIVLEAVGSCLFCEFTAIVAWLSENMRYPTVSGEVTLETWCVFYLEHGVSQYS